MDGVLLIDKPVGASSHHAVSAVRRALGIRKVGHAGTLDPFATGLLLILVGRATRLQQYLMPLPKCYRARAQFGVTSTTLDTEGELTQTGNIPDFPLELPTGVIRQRPPAYSAIHINGKRAYQLAREGKAVEIPEREVTVYRFEATEYASAEAEFIIECSAGTYIRSLVAQLGDAYCTELRRLSIGDFHVDNAICPHEAAPEHFISLNAAISHLPAHQLSLDEATDIIYGRKLPTTLTADAVRLMYHHRLVAIGEADGSTLRIKVGMMQEPDELVG
jgi:tRNA pseudouridine55 synthase